MRKENSSDDSRFDDQMRSSLQSLPVLPPPKELFRHPGRRVSRQVIGWISAAAVALLLMAAAWIYPPTLVNSAWAHVEEEQGLRGDWIHNPTRLSAALDLRLGQPIPGLVQLRKNCVVDGHHAYHVSTFIDGKGWVTILSFQEPVTGAQGEGQWLGRHWKFLHDNTQHPVLLLSDNADALRYVAQALSQTPRIG